jgi:hypothetical protein
MMAVAALSLAHQEGSERLDALQHYQKALPALQSNLRSADDLSSDGAFLTHFLLLVYEVSGWVLAAFLKPQLLFVDVGCTITCC